MEQSAGNGTWLVREPNVLTTTPVTSCSYPNMGHYRNLQFLLNVNRTIQNHDQRPIKNHPQRQGVSNQSRIWWFQEGMEEIIPWSHALRRAVCLTRANFEGSCICAQVVMRVCMYSICPNDVYRLNTKGQTAIQSLDAFALQICQAVILVMISQQESIVLWGDTNCEFGTCSRVHLWTTALWTLMRATSDQQIIFIPLVLTVSIWCSSTQ